MATSPLLIVLFFSKINKVEAIEEMGKLCKFHENQTKKVPYWVENIVKKREIDCHKQFLLFSQCFPQLNILTASKCGIV